MAARTDRRKTTRRVAATILLAMLLAPGTLLRTLAEPNAEQALDLLPVAAGDLDRSNGPVSRSGLWELRSPNSLFGGYSALLPLEEDALRLFSDRGSMLTFSLADASPRFDSAWDRPLARGEFADIESATRDPATGDYWVGYENIQTLVRHDSSGQVEREVQPAEWQRWPVNAGAEAMVRLSDGRFIVLPEAGATGLLYPGDPAEGAAATPFRYVRPQGFAPTDMAQLPDGRVLVLLRKVATAFPPFSARLAVADPAQFTGGEVWQLDVVADLDAILPRENYEGLGIIPQPDGSATIWLVSDDNLAALQRTLLARLEWRDESGSAQ